MDYAFKYTETSSLEAENDYPYVGTAGTCTYDSKKGKVKATSVKDVTPNRPEQLKAALKLGPVSVAIQADSRVFQSYSGGVLNSQECGTEIDHGVLAVGYGKEGDLEYILVKNSWGADWGDHGFIKIALTEGKGTCGINQ